jgi:hypothetical protein
MGKALCKDEQTAYRNTYYSDTLTPQHGGIYTPSYCWPVGGFSAWGFKFMLYGAKFVSEGHYEYFSNN